MNKIICLRCIKYEEVIKELRKLIQLQTTPPAENCVVNYFEIEEQWEVLNNAVSNLNDTQL